MASRKPETVIRDIGLRIRELRREHGWTQEEFAERAGVAPRYVRYLEAGQNLQISTLVEFAKVLRAKPEELFAKPRTRVRRAGRPRKE